jgi:hypothetical protein
MIVVSLNIWRVAGGREDRSSHSLPEGEAISAVVSLARPDLVVKGLFGGRMWSKRYGARSDGADKRRRICLGIALRWHYKNRG